MQRVSDAVAWPFGFLYLSMIALAVSTIRDPSLFSTIEACHRIEAMTLPLWYCGEQPAVWFLANLANAAILLTVWIPVLFAAALVDGDMTRVAMPVVLFHIIGLLSAAYVGIRSGEMVLQLARRAVRQAANRISPSPR